MATYYEALPIYKAATDLAVLLVRVVRGFSRYHKYTLGSRMRETAIAIVLRDLAVAFECPWPSANVKARRLAYLFEPAQQDAPTSSNVTPPAGKEDRHG